MKLVIPKPRRQPLQFSLRSLLCVSILFALTIAAVTSVRTANQKQLAAAKLAYAKQVRDYEDRLLILRTTENIENIPSVHR
jgi:hypothetical protein